MELENNRRQLAEFAYELMWKWLITPAPIQQRDLDVPREDLISRLLLDVKDRIYLDETREEFSNIECAVLADLAMGSISSNGRCRVLLGRKDVGKTLLLKTLAGYKYTSAECLRSEDRL